MATTTMTLEQVITVVKELPPELRQEVGDFALFLHKKKLQQEQPERNQQHTVIYEKTAPTLKWMGALKELRTEYTSVELQHKAQEWIVASLTPTSTAPLADE